jgi:hypothetical protein
MLLEALGSTAPSPRAIACPATTKLKMERNDKQGRFMIDKGGFVLNCGSAKQHTGNLVLRSFTVPDEE